MGLVALLAVSTVNAGVFELPQHDGYQTPFVPVPGPQALPLESAPQAGYLPPEPANFDEAPLPGAPAAFSENAHLATAQLQVSSAPQYQVGQVQSVPLQAAAPAPILSAPVALTQPILSQPTVQLQKTIIKHVQVSSFFSYEDLHFCFI